MTRKKTFADSFWASDPSDFCSSTGLDNLVRRLKDGRQICKDFEEFLKRRAKIEEDYARAVSSLAKGNSGHLEIGTMKNSWDTMKQQMESVAKEHSQLASTFLERAKAISLFAEQQKALRKSQDENVHRQLRKKVEAFNKNTQCKKSYDKACKDAKSAKDQVHNAKMAGNSMEKVTPTGPKSALQKSPAAQFQALQTKELKCQADQERADQNYKEANAVLEATRKGWETAMLSLCEEFEKLEIERFNFLRNEFWVHTNAISQCCVAVDVCCEQIRLSIEETDVDQDLMQFINAKGTGSIRPATIHFKKYGEPDARPPVPPPTHMANR